MTQNGTFESLLIEVANFLEPLADAATQPPIPQGVIDLAAGAGFDLNEVLVNVTPVADFASAFGKAYVALRPMLQTGEIQPSQLPMFISSIRTLFFALDGLDNLQTRAGTDPDDARIGQRLVEYLLFLYLKRRHPGLYNLFLLIGAIRKSDSKQRKISRLDLSRLTAFVQDPGAVLTSEYKWGTSTFDSYLLLQRIQAIGWHIGLPSVFHYPEQGQAAAFGADSKRDHPDLQLRIPITVVSRGNISGQVGIAMLPILSSTTGLPGLAIIPFGAGSITESVDLDKQWQFSVDVVADVAVEYGIVMSTDGINLVGLGQGTLPPSFKVTARIERQTPSTKSEVLLQSPKGLRLEVGAVGLQVGFAYGNATEVFFELPVKAGQLTVGVSDDGFLQKILPKDGIRVDFDLTVGWSNKKGLYFKGGAGLETTLPVNIDLFGVIKIDSVYLGLETKAEEGKESSIQAVTATTIKVNLGPISAVVEKFGLQATLSFPEKGGNLGVANLDLGFQHPKGAALSIDAGVVVGGGFLFFKKDTQQYGGMVHLEIAESLNLNAIGLITTRLPDGSPGFSMLVLIAVEFAPPIQLGYGFSLKGIGGILGINRTVAVEALRSGLRAGTLGSILLPQDPLANAPKIISDLNTVFPPAEGRFVFGPMILLAWGPNNLIQLQIGLMLELPAPARLFILGRLRVLLPEEKHPIVKLQLDALGVIDFGNGDISLDAVLFDSEIKGFVITGEMALRANVGATPGFVLAVGGFHPAFPAPAGFPALKRVTISLATGDNPRLRLAAYFALTTNTVQFGASLDFLVEAGPFSVEGHFTFDALIQFAPFGLAVSMTAMVAIKAGTTVLLAVQLDLSLTGPTPWHIWGKAHFQLLFISVTVDFDATIGQEQPPPLPPPVDIRPLLLAALKESRNWGTQLPQGEHPLVVLREVQLAESKNPQGTEPLPLLVHPLANLHVSQQVIPFDHEVTKFGNTIPEGERKFTLLVKNEKDEWIGPESEGSIAEKPVWVTDKFAPAQFRTMSDDEKLRAPAFEEYRSGVRLSFGGYACGEPVIEEQAEYEESATVRPPQQEGVTLVALTLPAAYVLTPSFLQQMALLGSVGQATLHHSGRAKFRQESVQSSKRQGININPRKFEVYDRQGVAAPAPSKTSGESFFAKLESVTKPRGDLAWKKSRTRVRPKLATVGHE